MWERLLLTLKNVFSNTALTSEDLLNLLFSLFLAIFFSFIISQVYKYTHYGMNFEQSFMVSLVLLGPIVTAVMLFIQGNLIISLGLVGSLSIIRFRTPIKDTLDMVFLFWIIATGLGCGTYNWTITIVFSIILLTAILIMHFVKYGSARNRDFVLIITGTLAYPLAEVEKIIKTFTSDARIRSHEVEDEHWQVIFEIRFEDVQGSKSKEFILALQNLSEVHKISLLAPQLALPL